MNTINKFGFALLAIGFITSAYSQQVPLYSNYFFTPYIYNPAMSGLSATPELSAIFRRQWTGFDGAPQTAALAFNGASLSNKVGYSVYAYNDQASLLERNAIYGAYAYKVQFGDKNFIDFGIGAGYLNQSINVTLIRNSDRFDPAVFGQVNGRSIFDVNIGVNARINNLMVGAAVPQLFSSPIKFLDQPTAQVLFSAYRHYNLMAQYDLNVQGDRALLSPLVMIRGAEGVPAMIDAGAMLRIPKYGHLGFMYRTDYAVTLNVGVNITDQLMVGYAHDFSISEYSRTMGNSNEIILTWRFGSSSKIDRIENEIKKLKQQQSKKDENTEKLIKDRLEELREEIRREYQRQAEQQASQQPPQSAGGQKGTQPASQVGTKPQQPTQGSGNQQQGGTGYTSGGQPIQQSEMASSVVPGSKGFYVVAGVFSNLSNAERLTAELKNKGFDARYFQDKNNNMYYVYLFKFDTYAKANQVRQNKIDGRYTDELWIKIVD
ncbi:MAG: PorP/SprF family type IX secretion system membrane protein [Thermaurantimonas sp.]|uniref:PorP/SprF family type IX secretion system membrane protein n=1 Tax=Thermaurantimonas sp. TaxID=2681568 RepID=UPI00391C2A1D